ncbi:kynureninase [Bacillus sp. ISL-40]|uniref:kynureninase n=1 Tax=unclassified Bacillus (in: firmicutes) TaxID=185979 RepID=UPI001BE50498|nr:MULTISPECIES: kynureninase [unclassified Bacillus (in: firmicutes)]MBT2696769.1 kynureninase [Bacillus sp. ISL-40]MBT2721229.1 kynureninase [Bacillus sp. ISL-46]MBT2740085.1 kynureninase [Bacillus sp. ISL-77]
MLFTLEYAKQLDQEDILNRFREEFYIKPNSIYMDGNSLGLLSKRAERTLLESLNDWKEHGIDGWMSGNNPWFSLSEKLGEMMAPLVGGSANEVIVTGSTTVNLHQLVATFYKPEGTRTKILADELTFPSDIYALQSQLRIHGFDPDTHLIRVKSRDGRFLEEEDIIEAMTDEIALIILPTVLYRSGQILDMKRLTAEATRRGILIGFDGCHSIGAIPHSFSEWGVDFAYWCNYKHLNGGPGSVGGLYVNSKHFGTAPGLAGWFGSKKEKQFDMEHSLTPADSAGAYQIGTPHVLSLAPLLGALEIFAEAGIEKIRAKSLKINQFLMDLLEQELSDMGLKIGNPVEDVRRGGHVSLEHKEAARICKALKENGVIPDFRAPNIIRLAPVALYTSYKEVWEVVQILKKIMTDKQYEKFKNEREVVA